MTLKISANLKHLTSQAQSYRVPTSLKSIPLGKVYGVITTPNTPTKELYEGNGQWNNMGLIFYKDYNSPDVKNIDNTLCIFYTFHLIKIKP